MTTPIGWKSRSEQWTELKQCAVTGAHAMILRVSSFFCVAPLRFKSHKNGYVVSLSVPKCIWSCLIVTVMIAICITWLIADMQSAINDFYASSLLSKFLLISDTVMAAFMGSAAVFGAPGRMRIMIQFMNTIASVDNNLRFQYSCARERRLSACLIIYISWCFIVLSCYFVSIWARYEDKYEAIDLLYYLMYCILWKIMILLDAQFACTVSLVCDRFKAINESLSRTATILCKPYVAGEDRLSNSPIDAVQRFASIHGILCDLVDQVQNSYSISLVLVVISSQFHLITTVYFGITQFNVNDNGMMTFVILQAMSCSLHLLRLLMLVEPCYYTTAEGNNMKRIVCRMLTAAPTSGKMAFHLEVLSRQLMMRTVSYRPMAACALDRPLLAAVFGVVITYLVMLIQFQNYET